MPLWISNKCWKSSLNLLEPGLSWQRMHTQWVPATRAGCAGGVGLCARIERQLPAELPVCMLLYDHSLLIGVTTSLLRASLFQHQLSGSSPQECEALLYPPCWPARWKGWWGLALGDPAGEPKRNPAPRIVLQEQLPCHVDGVCLSGGYLLGSLQIFPLSLQQCCAIEIMQAVQLRAFPARTPTLWEHPTARTPRTGWQPEASLSSGCLQEKFGGTVTQFLLLRVLKAKEHFVDWTLMQPWAPVQRLYLRRMIVSHSSVTSSLLGVVGCNSFFSLRGRRTGHASGWVANNFSQVAVILLTKTCTEIFRWVLCFTSKATSLPRFTLLLCLPNPHL